MKKVVILLIFFFNSLHAVIPEKVLICGVCRDVADRLPHAIKIVENIGDLFLDYRVIVYENNSTDSTVKILNDWSNKNANVTIYNENVPDAVLSKEIVNICQGKFFRPELIARARNIALDKAMSSAYDEYPYIIWVDLDFKIPPKLEGFIEVFESYRYWDAVFAYGIDPQGCFWDWFALRDKIEPLGPELIGHDWYKPKRREFNQNDDWYPVYSAFGGCGIYKKSSIKGCRYSATVTRDLEEVVRQILYHKSFVNHPVINQYFTELPKLQKWLLAPEAIAGFPEIKDPLIGLSFDASEGAIAWRMNSFTYQYPVVCEHVTFHASMIVRGHGNLFINPRLIFTYGG